MPSRASGKRRMARCRAQTPSPNTIPTPHPACAILIFILYRASSWPLQVKGGSVSGAFILD